MENKIINILPANYYSHIASYMTPSRPNGKHFLTLVDHVLVKQNEAQEFEMKSIDLNDPPKQISSTFNNAIQPLLK